MSDINKHFPIMDNISEESKVSRTIDWFFNKAMPKKFIVFVVATIALFLGLIGGDLWAYISMIYLGSNMIAKFAGAIGKKNGK